MGTDAPSMAEDGDESLEAVSQLDACLTDVESQLRPLSSKPLKELQAGLPPLEAAKLNVVGAFAINTLFYIFLKTQGVDPAKHPVKAELDRVKTYFKKIRDASQGTTATEANNAQLNVGAANRFIAAALGPEGSELRKLAEPDATTEAPAKAAKSSKKKRKADPEVEEAVEEADVEKKKTDSETPKKKKKKAAAEDDAVGSGSKTAGSDKKKKKKKGV